MSVEQQIQYLRKLIKEMPEVKQAIDKKDIKALGTLLKKHRENPTNLVRFIFEAEKCIESLDKNINENKKFIKEFEGLIQNADVKQAEIHGEVEKIVKKAQRSK